VTWNKNQLIIILLLIVSCNKKHFEIPQYNNNDQIIHHNYYTLKYNNNHKQAEWTAYKLTADHTFGKLPRTNNFRLDPYVSTNFASLEDYRGSGYDRGHLVPAGDMKWDSVAMSESFYLSNISPQKPGFNRGIWKKLENQVRIWAKDNELLYIVTGGVLESDLSTIGNNKVSIPKYFYKVILDYKEPEIKAIGFILPNEPSKLNISNFFQIPLLKPGF